VSSLLVLLLESEGVVTGNHSLKIPTHYIHQHERGAVSHNSRSHHPIKQRLEEVYVCLRGGDYQGHTKKPKSRTTLSVFCSILGISYRRRVEVGAGRRAIPSEAREYGNKGRKHEQTEYATAPGRRGSSG
jgi:hypothetical protein